MHVLIAIAVAGGLYIALNITGIPSRIDLIVEALLFSFAGTVGLGAYLRKSGRETRRFRKFELFYGLTYSVVAISSLLGIFFLFTHPQVHEIGIATVEGSPLLQAMAGIKSLSFVCMFAAWFYFYRNLQIQAGILKKTIAFLTGFGGYFGSSLIIMSITGDSTILSLGLIVGAAIGLFAMIALHPSTRYLSAIFLLFSVVHLWEFYLMGVGAPLVTGLNNPVYWLLIYLYTVEVRRWIRDKQYSLDSAASERFEQVA